MKRVKIETERQDLFDVSIVIAMRIHVKGNVTEEALRVAFDKAVKAHEILSMKVSLGKDGLAYYVTNDEADKNCVYFEDKPWMDILKREEKQRFSIEEGELLKCFCYELSDEGCKLMFLMHHLGGDGKSMVYFIESFMNALSGAELEFREIRTIPAGNLEGKALRDRLGPYAIYTKIFNSLWEKEKERRIFDYSDLDKAYESYWKNRESDVAEYVISPEKVEKILESCREWKIGFTAYIMTHFMKKMGRKLDVGYALDFRKDKNRSMGNQASGLSLKYEYNTRKSFKVNAQKVQELLDDKLSDDQAREFVLPFMAALDPTLLDALNLEHAGTFSSNASKIIADMLGYGKKTKDLSVTNLTRLDIPDTYGELKIDFFSFIPPVVSYGKNVVGVSTLGDSTVIVLHRTKKF